MISEKMRTLNYRPSALVRVTGEDAFTFLQGQFTNELRQPPGSVSYGLWLNQKAKVLADSQVLRISEKEFLICSEFSPAAIIRQRLEEYIVADDVAVADETATGHALALWGEGGKAAITRLFGEAPVSGRFVRSGELLVYGGRRLPGDNWEILGSEMALREIGEQLQAAGAVEIKIGRAHV